MPPTSFNEGNGNLATRANVDIYQYPFPTDITSPPEGSVVTLGDLHGSAAKFLHMLVREGIVEISKKNYDELEKIYKKSHKDKYDQAKFVKLLQQIKLKNPCPALRLIGDDLADRGKNDLLTLRIFERLRKLNANVEIIASNHGIEFLQQFSYGINDELKIIYRGKNSFFGASLYGLRKDIKNGIITADAVDSIITKNYLPNIKLLSYLINDDGNISIYSHAPINETKIKNLARLMKVNYMADTVQDLAKTIDAINQAFNEIVTDKKCLKSFFENQHNRKNSPNTFSILNDFINGRYENLTPDKIAENENVRNYKVSNIHGHVGEKTLAANPEAKPPDNWSYYNLDTNLAKSSKLTKHNYVAYISKESQYTPEIKMKIDIRNKLQQLIKNSANTKNEKSKLFLARADIALLELEKPNGVKKALKILQGKYDWEEDLKYKKIKSLFSVTMFSKSAQINEKLLKSTIKYTKKRIDQPNNHKKKLF